MIYFRALLRLILFLHSNFSDSFPDGAECCVPLSEDCVLDIHGIIAVVSSMLFGALIFSAIVNRAGDFVIYNFNIVSIYLCVLSFASCVLNFEITLNHSLELNTLSLSCLHSIIYLLASVFQKIWIVKTGEEQKNKCVSCVHRSVQTVFCIVLIDHFIAFSRNINIQRSSVVHPWRSD